MASEPVEESIEAIKANLAEDKTAQEAEADRLVHSVTKT